MHTTKLESTLFLALIVAVSWPASAQEWYRFDEADGLPSSNIRELALAEDGAVWAATANGLSRISKLDSPDVDWSQQAWTPIEGTVGRSYRCVVSGPSNIIWAGRENASGEPLIERFSDSGVRVELDGSLRSQLDSIILESVIRALLVSPDGNDLWIGTEGLLYRASQRSGAWLVTAHSLGGADAGVEDIAIDDTRGVWFANSQGLWRFEGSNARDAGLPLSGGLQSVRAARIEGTAWLLLGGALDDAVWAFHPREGQLLALPRDESVVSARPVRGLTVDGRGRVWVAGDQLTRYETVDATDATTWTLEVVATSPEPAGNDNSSVLSRPQDDTIWVGASGGAALLVNRWVVDSDDEGTIPTGQFQDMVLADNGQRAWVASLGGVGYFDGTEWTRAVTTGASPHAIALDSSGWLWVASPDPLSPRFEIRDAHSLKVVLGNLAEGTNTDRWNITDLALDERGVLWVAAAEGLRTIAAADTTALDDVNPPGIDVGLIPITHLDVDDRFLLVGKGSNLACLDRSQDTWTNVSLSRDLEYHPDVAIEDVVLLDGRAMVGTAEDGVLSMDAASLNPSTLVRRDATTDPVLTGGVRNLTVDDQTLWIGTERAGLRRFDAALDRGAVIELPADANTDDVQVVAAEAQRLWLGAGSRYVARRTLSPPFVEVIHGPKEVYSSPLELVEIQLAKFDPDGPSELVTPIWRVLGPSQEQGEVREGVIRFTPASLGLEDGIHNLEIWSRDSDLDLQRERIHIEFEMDLIPPEPTLLQPGSGETVEGTVDIVGTTRDVDRRFSEYHIGLRSIASSGHWELVSRGNRELVNETLTTWNTGLHVDDEYWLRLTVVDTLGVSGETFARIVIDNEFPYAAQTSPVRILGDRGGDVYSVRGNAQLTVPPFAFEGVQMLTLEEAANEGPRTFTVGPEGLALRRHARLRVIRGDDFGAALYRLDGVNWRFVGGTPEHIDGVHYVTASVDRAGTYSLRDDPSRPTADSGLVFLDAQPRHLAPRTGAYGEEFVISFELGQAASVRAVVYDRDGRPRRELVDERQFGAGRQVMTWDGRDHDGELVPVGLYIIAVEAAGQTRTQVVSVGYD